ncbi:hypothetical protein NVV99_24675 [Rhodococcus sp. PAE-6]|uniref:hypothetical protein n=1 Tax=unclassified Rhodococcus (in: high G+C Gram-positive bacteria) TaxID=192944 RepID=UPI0012F4F2CA|nr:MULTISPECIES: hypothetical protein [unclassified Rhodococcus (in: high G+C Gram-positive bacteria)]MCT7294093.1 hypothetical protein [Rhodococcus sp. PAE-6]
MSSSQVNQNDHHKHMEFVQSIITRLANNSFLLKGWSLTLVSALMGFAVAHDHILLAAAAVLPALVFWILDTYYLRQERAFRNIYDAVAAGTVKDFKINPRRYVPRHSWWAVAFSVSLSLFYGAMIVLIFLVTLTLALLSPAETNPSPYEIRVTTEGGLQTGVPDNPEPTLNDSATPLPQVPMPAPQPSETFSPPPS